MLERARHSAFPAHPPGPLVPGAQASAGRPPPDGRAGSSGQTPRQGPRPSVSSWCPSPAGRNPDMP
jgi:hypothetical protein